ncbi:MAG: hypothetical protein HYW25_02475 [Candidatus Aenigmarchaeota archaeon]|nr:hypothetical protein [Candidatus Aenigmarchaeota archaeon]
MKFAPLVFSVAIVIFVSGCVSQGVTEYPVKIDTGIQEEQQQSPAEEIQQMPPEEMHPEPEVREEPLRPASSFRQSPEIPSELEMEQISDCNGKQFTAAPVDLGRIVEITPLGNLGPPGHTFPTEHTFFHISAGGATTQTISLNSPADMHITLISFSHGITQDPVDYTIYFALCKDVVGYFNHVKEISADLQKIIDENECMFQGESKSTRCNVQTLEPIEANSPMGKVGRLQGNFDFGVLDLRKTNNFANPSRYGMRSLHIQCPFDYYDEAMQKQFFDLIERNDAQQCGVVMQDVPGTLKGNWFFGNSRADIGTDWDKHLAFVQDNEDPATSVISVGGTFADAGKWEFSAGSAGTVNRAFDQVKPDGKVYCYEAQGQSGRIIVQLTGETELKIEKQSESCAGSFAFSSPAVYGR